MDRGEVSPETEAAGVGEADSGGVRDYIEKRGRLGCLEKETRVNQTLSRPSRLPSETKINPKSFLTAFTFTRDPTRDRVQYLPNFDLITDPVDMKSLLEAASDYRSIPSDSAGIERLFRQFISFAVKELETDVGGTS
ncbi:hypothetical protein GCM10020360_16590 [Nonlabens tegetincola]